MSPEDQGKANIGKALKGIATHNPEDTSTGLMGGKPSTPDKFIAESRALQEQDPESVITKVKNNVIRALKTPTTIARSILETGHGATKWGTLQINKAIQQTRNLVAVALAIPVKGWEVASSVPKKVIQKITDTTHAAVDKVIGILPTNYPKDPSSPA